MARKPTGGKNGSPLGPTDWGLASELVRIKSRARWDALFDLENYLIDIGAPESDILLVENYISKDFKVDDPNIVILRELIDTMITELDKVPENKCRQKKILIDTERKLLEARKLVHIIYQLSPDSPPEKQSQDQIEKIVQIYNKVFPENAITVDEYRTLNDKPKKEKKLKPKPPTKKMKEEIRINRENMYSITLGKIRSLKNIVKTTRLTKADYEVIYWNVAMETSEVAFIIQVVDQLAYNYKNNHSNPSRVRDAIDMIAFQVIDKVFRVNTKGGKPYNQYMDTPQKVTLLKTDFNKKCIDAYRKYYKSDSSDDLIAEWIENGMPDIEEIAKNRKRNSNAA